MSKQNLQVADDSDIADLTVAESLFDVLQNASNYAKPLVKTDYRDFHAGNTFEGKWRPAPIPSHLLPFHCFSERQKQLTISLPVQRSETILNQMWDVSYLRPDDGTAESYVAELLVFKRKLYEQGNAVKPDGLPDKVRITSGGAFTLFTNNFGDEERCFELLQWTLLVNAHEKLTEAEGKQKTVSEHAFRRSASIYNKDETDEMTGEYSAEIGIDLTDYWLDWFESASAVVFDFEYLAKLVPLEMRIYELIKLLYYDRHILPLKTIADGKKQFQSREVALELDYELFAKLMPIPVLEERAEIETQIKNLCRIHIRRGFLHSVGFKENEIIFTFNKF